MQFWRFSASTCRLGRNRGIVSARSFTATKAVGAIEIQGQWWQLNAIQIHGAHLEKTMLILPDPSAIMIEGSLEVKLRTIWIIWTDMDR